MDTATTSKDPFVSAGTTASSSSPSPSLFADHNYHILSSLFNIATAATSLSPTPSYESSCPIFLRNDNNDGSASSSSPSSSSSLCSTLIGTLFAKIRSRQDLELAAGILDAVLTIWDGLKALQLLCPLWAHHCDSLNISNIIYHRLAIYTSSSLAEIFSYYAILHNINKDYKELCLASSSQAKLRILDILIILDAIRLRENSTNGRTQNAFDNGITLFQHLHATAAATTSSPSNQQRFTPSLPSSSSSQYTPLLKETLEISLDFINKTQDHHSLVPKNKDPILSEVRVPEEFSKTASALPLDRNVTSLKIPKIMNQHCLIQHHHPTETFNVSSLDAKSNTNETHHYDALSNQPSCSSSSSSSSSLLQLLNDIHSAFGFHLSVTSQDTEQKCNDETIPIARYREPTTATDIGHSSTSFADHYEGGDMNPDPAGYDSALAAAAAALLVSSQEKTQELSSRLNDNIGGNGHDDNNRHEAKNNVQNHHTLASTKSEFSKNENHLYYLPSNCLPCSSVLLNSIDQNALEYTELFGTAFNQRQNNHALTSNDYQHRTLSGSAEHPAQTASATKISHEPYPMPTTFQNHYYKKTRLLDAQYMANNDDNSRQNNIDPPLYPSSSSSSSSSSPLPDNAILKAAVEKPGSELLSPSVHSPLNTHNDTVCLEKTVSDRTIKSRKRGRNQRGLNETTTGIPQSSSHEKNTTALAATTQPHSSSVPHHFLKGEREVDEDCAGSENAAKQDPANPTSSDNHTYTNKISLSTEPSNDQRMDSKPTAPVPQQRNTSITKPHHATPLQYATMDLSSPCQGVCWDPTHQRWVAHWSDAKTHQRIRRYFNPKSLGFNYARLLAVLTRKEAVESGRASMIAKGDKARLIIGDFDNSSSPSSSSEFLSHDDNTNRGIYWCSSTTAWYCHWKPSDTEELQIRIFPVSQFLDEFKGDFDAASDAARRNAIQCRDRVVALYSSMNVHKANNVDNQNPDTNNEGTKASTTSTIIPTATSLLSLALSCISPPSGRHDFSEQPCHHDNKRPLYLNKNSQFLSSVGKESLILAAKEDLYIASSPSPLKVNSTAVGDTLSTCSTSLESFYSGSSADDTINLNEG